MEVSKLSEEDKFRCLLYLINSDMILRSVELESMFMMGSTSISEFTECLKIDIYSLDFSTQYFQSNLSICLSVCVFIYLSVYASVYLSICLSFCLSVHLSIYLILHIYNLYVYLEESFNLLTGSILSSVMI